MATFIKAKLNKSDDHYFEIHDDKAIISCKNVCKNIKSQHVKNGCTDILVLIIKLLRFLQGTKRLKE